MQNSKIFIKLYLFLGLVVFVSGVKAQQPIPTRYDGHSAGYANATILLEAYLDLLCPDCKAAFPTMFKMFSLQFYNSFKYQAKTTSTKLYYGPEKVNFIVHVFPLPYHRASFFAATGARVSEVLAKIENPWLVYASMLFDAQEEFGNSAVYNHTDDEVYLKLAKLAADPKLGIDAQKFYETMHNEEYREDTVVSWKFAASRAVFGTPTFAMNGVKIDAGPEWTLADWKKLVDPYLRQDQ